MAVLYDKYVNSTDHTWYDSTNVLYSECYDNNDKFKNLKLVFKGGRTYLYKDVDINDYLLFKNSESNGKSANEFIIKKYKGFRITDTDLTQLNETKEHFINSTKSLNDKLICDLNYKIVMDNNTNEFTLYLDNDVIYKGKENEVSIFKLLKSMGINYSFSNKENNNE